MLFEVLFSLLLIFLVIFEIKRKRISSQFHHIPNLNEFPLIGDALHYLGITPDNSFDKLNALIFRYPIMKSVIGHYLRFSVCDPDVAKEIFLNNDCLGRPKEVEYFHLDYGLISAQVDMWKYFRRPISSTLNQFAVMTMTPMFNRYISKLSDEFKSLINAGHFNLVDILVNISTQQLIEALIGVQSTEQESNKIYLGIDGAGAVVAARMINPFLQPELIYKFSAISEEFKTSYDQVSSCLNQLYDKRTNMKVNGKCLFDKLYEMENVSDPLHRIKTHHNLNTMIAAGYESTALAIAYSILMLAMHPDVDQKLYNEIKTHYVTGSEIDHEIVKNMKYLEMVVKEVLRLFPVVPFSARKTVNETYIEKIGKIPKDAIFLISIFNLHRCPQYWGPNSNAFNPENFLPEKIQERNPNCYIPFLNGSRNCVGLNYANLNIRLTLVRILSQFRFTTKLKYDELKFNLAIVLRLKTGHLVEVHERKNQ